MISRFSWPSIIDILSSGPKTTMVPPPDSNDSNDSNEFKAPTALAPRSLAQSSIPAAMSPWSHPVSIPRPSNVAVLREPLPLDDLRTPGPGGIPASHESNSFELPESIQVENEAMQSSCSELNGWVSPRLPRHEMEVLRDVFGMRIEWDGVDDEQTVALAKAVNPNEPGHGQFSGVVSEETS